MEYSSKLILGQRCFYRANTSDERVLEEVVSRRCYRRAKIGFDVEAGETWLDLGANIGAFALYCKTRKATVECYEPSMGCYNLLIKNAREFICHRSAVTSQRRKKVSFFISCNASNHSRGSIIHSASLREYEDVNNTYAGDISKKFSGVKMDIEGSEFGIIDNRLIPKCDKLVLEYHTSRDQSMENLKRRIEVLKSLFRHVQYPPEYDRRIAEGGKSNTFFDRNIFCWGPKR